MLSKKVIIDHERYDELRAMLEERRQEIQKKLRSLRETLPADNDDVKDTEEQSVDDFVQEVDFALMQMKSQTLAKIDEAVRRLEKGRYGVVHGVRHGDRGGAPEGPALRGPVPRVPGGRGAAGRGGAGVPRLPEPARQGVRSGRPLNAAGCATQSRANRER